MLCPQCLVSQPGQRGLPFPSEPEGLLIEASRLCLALRLSALGRDQSCLQGMGRRQAECPGPRGSEEKSAAEVGHRHPLWSLLRKDMENWIRKHQPGRTADKTSQASPLWRSMVEQPQGPALLLYSSPVGFGGKGDGELEGPPRAALPRASHCSYWMHRDLETPSPSLNCLHSFV